MPAGAFVARAVARRPQSAPVEACYYAVRDLPYALDGAHDAAGLLVQGRGDCLAKSELLRLAAGGAGLPGPVCVLALSAARCRARGS
jgi:hypothetical protein